MSSKHGSSGNGEYLFFAVALLAVLIVSVLNTPGLKTPGSGSVARATH